MLSLLALAATLTSSALANGLTSHQWITLQAIDNLPAGELQDLLRRDDVRDALLCGALFPDGGYAVGDDYGEMAHWEPFQLSFMDWIIQNGGSDQEKAFLFGLASHGMGDQTFDSMFMERSRVYDAEAGWAEGLSMDEATDVALVAAVGPGLLPAELGYPPIFLELFAAQGHEVSADTVETGTRLAEAAIAVVGAMGQTPATVESYDAQFPWANAHIVDPDTRCSPVCEARIVASYWQVLWERLQGGDGWSQPVIATLPDDGGMGQPIEVDSPESRLSVIFARGLDPAFVVPGSITVADAAGADIPVSLNLFYGTASHVILVAPLEGWVADTDYTVTVHPGLMSFDGMSTTDPYVFGFSTRIPEDPPPEDVGGSDDGKVGASPEPGCGCTAGSSPSWPGLLGIGLLRRRRRR